MSAELLKARLEAIARGDKALGRELYHKLLNLGLRPEDIHSPAEAPTEAAEAPESPQEPTEQGPRETAEAPGLPERAVAE